MAEDAESLLLHDFEEPRLDINGFVTDYFTWRIAQDGLEWYERPELVFGTQPEHISMRAVASIFEKRHADELQSMVLVLTSDEQLSYDKYCEMVDHLGRNMDEEDPQMSYGRLVGLISFGGCMAARLAELNQRREIAQIALYTAKFIDKRIRLSWVNDARTWQKFMLTSREVIRRQEVSESLKASEERSKNIRRLLGFLAVCGVGLGVVVYYRLHRTK